MRFHIFTRPIEPIHREVPSQQYIRSVELHANTLIDDFLLDRLVVKFQPFGLN